MLAIQRAAASSDECMLNIVPCRIHRDGPAKVTKRFWNPSKEADGSSTVYFRGRKLRGRTVKLPPDYQGLVLKSTARCLPQTPACSFPRSLDEDEDEDEDDMNGDVEEERPETVKVVEEVSKFEELLVWGHDQMPAADDSFAKGVQEWISFAEAIHQDKDDSKSVDTRLSSDQAV